MLYGVEGNSTFLECSSHPQAELRWTFQNTEEQQRGGGGTRDGRELVRRLQRHLMSHSVTQHHIFSICWKFLLTNV